MKIKFFTTFGNSKPQRVIECESVIIIGNELHYSKDGWNIPLAYLNKGKWYPATGWSKSKFDLFEVEV